VAVLLGVEDEEELGRLLLAHSKGLRAILSEARQQIREEGGIPYEQFWQKVEAEAV
jgi:hypothetical protein